ncbi:hypothetical protein AB0J21_05060 [Streptomyces sp. NPDC049954]|uniref:hypothetical protein n=1 Tax=Streptomyces sp. NPDC049954 TaxID=3155779 RepID=UPI0034139D9E
MAQSGHGGEPRPSDGRQAREGVVLPADGGAPLTPGPAATPAGGTPWGPAPTGQQQGPGYGYPQPPHAQQPPQQPYGDGGYASPQGPGPIPPVYGAGGADSEATQYIAPISGDPGPAGGPGAFGPDSEATQYIAPVPGGPSPLQGGQGPGPGALPPENTDQATAYLGRVRPGGEPGPDQQSTQYLPPVPAGPGAPSPYEESRTQPPAEFDNLFRTESPQGPGAFDEAGSTQQMPVFTPGAPGGPGQAPPPPYGQTPPPYGQQPGYGRQPGYGQGGGYEQDGGYGQPPRSGGGRRSGGDDARRRKNLVIAAAAGVVVLAGVGLGAGALLSGGGDDSPKTSAVSATSPTTDSGAGGDEGDEQKEQPKPSPSADPVKQQAVELDKLLGDSNNSRDAVVRSVGNIGQCKALGQAASDLRGAAKQRNELVTRLGALPVDKLPQHDRLTAALNRAWKASATADSHYANWASGGCRGGHPRASGQRAAGDRASGQATSAKQEAAGLWNAIAKQYGLSERDKSQL